MSRVKWAFTQEDVQRDRLVDAFVESFPPLVAEELADAVVAAHQAAGEIAERIESLMGYLEDGNPDIVFAALRRIKDSTVSSNGIGGYWQEVVSAAGAAVAVVNIGSHL